MMTFKEALFFIGKCLTINHEKHNYIIVEKVLKEATVDWDSIVKVSTAHYVFPALYCNLKKANFLNYVPNDLVEYMEHITQLNRERNQQIIAQAKEINKLLLDHNITPIFLKGTGNLLEGLYNDIGERMVGDIDFLVDLEDYDKTPEILKTVGYSSRPENYLDFKHYPRLTNESGIAALEVHKRLLINKYDNEFNYCIVSKTILTKNSFNFLSYKDQLSLSIIAKQINDDGQFYNNIALRNSYDVFLLSQKVNSLESITKFHKLFNPLNNFLAITTYTLNSNSIHFDSNNLTKNALTKFEKITVRELKQQRITRKLFITKRLTIIYKSFFSKEYKNWLLKKITSKKWQQQKLIQLGLKKPKPNL